MSSREIETSDKSDDEHAEAVDLQSGEMEAPLSNNSPVVVQSPPSDGTAKNKIDEGMLPIPKNNQKARATFRHLRVKNPLFMCYAIASHHLLFGFPKFCEQILNCASPRELVEKSALDSLKYYARCSLGQQIQDKHSVAKHSGNLFKTIAYIYCDMNPNDEQDPAEYITKLLLYLEEKIACPAHDLFKCVVQTDSVSCKKCNIAIDGQLDEQKLFKVSITANKTVEQLVANSLIECLELQCCNKEIIRKSKIIQIPELFIVHLKRYAKDAQGNLVKLKTSVDLSLELKMLAHGQNKEQNSSTKRASSGTSYIYDLRGFVLHRGDEISKGHFTTYAYDEESETNWIYINDGKMSAVKISTALMSQDVKQNCYILAYEKRSV